MQSDWIPAPAATPEFLAALQDLHPLTAQVLFARGLTQPAAARDFLTAQVPLVNPFELRDMNRAVARVLQAVAAGERIAVYGDYDCDGVTACALMMTTLHALGANAHCYIPDRFEEGYGLNSGALDTLKASGATLVITVDCGVRAMKEADHARDIGLDLIVTDHHEPEPNELPNAFAVINPKQPLCNYPFKQLAGVGVAFRLAQALLRTHREQTGKVAALKEKDLLDLVAIGTVADLVPLTHQNRALVKAGLEQIRSTPRLGVKALVASARLALSKLDAGNIGFGLAPRLNAAGRLEHALAAYDLLMTADAAQAHDIAAQLSQTNEERQSITAQLAREAELEAFKDYKTETEDAPNALDKRPSLLFASSETYNAGVIGLAAARLVEKFYLPSVVITISNGEARGSCRSVSGFHITDALDECKSLLLKHGGHAAAAGFTTKTSWLAELQKRLHAIAQVAQPETGWRKQLKVDAEVSLGAINWKAQRELQQLEPHGMGNAKPVFVSRGVRVAGAQRMGKPEGKAGQPHLKLKLKDERGAMWDALMWRAGERLNEFAPGAVLDIAFQLDTNEWQGEQRLQLDMKDARVVQTPVVAQ